MKKNKSWIDKERLDIRHPKNIQAWKDLDEDMKKNIEKGAELFAKNAGDVLKKLSKE